MEEMNIHYRPESVTKNHLGFVRRLLVAEISIERFFKNCQNKKIRASQSDGYYHYHFNESQRADAINNDAALGNGNYQNSSKLRPSKDSRGDKSRCITIDDYDNE